MSGRTEGGGSDPFVLILTNVCTEQGITVWDVCVFVCACIARRDSEEVRVSVLACLSTVNERNKPKPSCTRHILHKGLQYNLMPPRGALNLWSFVRHGACPPHPLSSHFLALSWQRVPITSPNSVCFILSCTKLTNS